MASTYTDMANRLIQFAGYSNVPKNVPGRGDFVDAIKRGMQPKPKIPGQDYPKKVKVTT